MRVELVKLNSQNSEAHNRPTLVWIPGGPGLSSNTLRSMDILLRSFNLVYVDLPGTKDLPEAINPTFSGVCDAIATALESIVQPKVFCGHSFGGLFASMLVSKTSLNAVAWVGLSVPITERTYKSATDIYYANMTTALKEADDAWESNPSRATLSKLFASYGKLYFPDSAVNEGNSLLAHDPMSPVIFKELLPMLTETPKSVDFLRVIGGLSVSKYLIGGSLDALFPPSSLSSNAELAGATFTEIKDAGHFTIFDQPEAVAAQIETWFSTAKEGTKK